MPFGFILADPLHNAVAGGWLLFAFIGTGSSFLAFAALAAKHQIDNPGYAHKSFYYIGGLTEGTETILLFVLCCLFPAHFVWAGVGLRRTVLADDGDPHLQRLPDAEAGSAPGVGQLYAAIRPALSALYRIFRIAAPLVPAAVVDRDVFPTHRAGVHKGL
nr:phosphatidylglycerophosphate synthase [Raoultella sp. NCTC 9187]